MLAFRARLLAPAFVALAAACGGNSDNRVGPGDSGAIDAVAADAVAADADPDGHAAADAGADGPSAECSCAGVKSGTRLRAIFGTESSPDGARSRYSEQVFFDTVRNEECEFPYDAPAGPTRCLPTQDRYTGQVFTDAACTKAIAVSPAGVCAAAKTPKYLTVGSPSACTPVSPKIYPIVAETTAGDTFSLLQQPSGPATCVKNQVLPGAKYFTVGPEIDQAVFAAGTKTKDAHPDECACGKIHSGTRLEARADVVVAADGARTGGYVSRWYDKELDVVCNLERYTTLGPGWCVPEGERQVLWADAACTTTPILAHSLTSCVPLTKYALTDSAPIRCSGSPPRLFPVGAETTLPATYYSLGYDAAGTATCTKVVGGGPSGVKYYALGSEIPQSKLATYATTFEQASTGTPTAGETAECACGDTVSGSRVRAVYQMSRGADGMRQREPSAWYDLTRKEDCHRAYDGTLRPEGHCLPANDVLSYGHEYSDATCTLRIPFVAPQACAPAAPPKYLFSGPLTAECATVPEPHVYVVSSETTAATSWYEGASTANAVTCTAASGAFPVPGAKFYTPGAEIPATEFAKLSYVRAAE